MLEGQELDDFADNEKLFELRDKDEKDDWEKLRFEDISTFSSSIFFFDAKGMRFHLPKFLIFDLMEKELNDERGILSNIEMAFILRQNINHEKRYNKFSLLNNIQKNTIILFLEYKLNEFIENYNKTYIIFRLTFNLITNRRLLMNWYRQVLYWVSIISISYFAYTQITYKKRKHIA